MKVELSEIKSFMIDKIAEELDVETSSIDIDSTFHELGLDSISSIYILNELEDKYDIQLKVIYLLDYPTVVLFAHYVQTLIDGNA